MKPLKTKVSITLDTDVIETIKDLAENDDRSFSQYINLVLKDFLSNQAGGALPPTRRGGPAPCTQKTEQGIYFIYSALFD